MNLVDPLKQPQRFVQQADALVRANLAHPESTDPGAAIDAGIEASFAHVLAEMLPGRPEGAAAPAPRPDTAAPPHAGDSSRLYAGAVLGIGGPLIDGAAPPSTSVAPLGAGLGAPAAWSAAGEPAGVAGATDGRLAELSPLIAEMSGRYQVPDWLVRNVIRAESAGNPAATSPVGAMGLMQLMPDTARELGVLDAYDPRQNIEAGTKYLGRLLSQFGGDPVKAVAAYNAGPGAVERYNGVPPFAETQGYVRRVLDRS